MKFRSVFMALSCAFALAACGGQDGSASVQAGSAAAEVPAGSVKVQTARGEAVVPQNPERVAVYDLGAVDTLSKLGVKIGASVDDGANGQYEGERQGAHRCLCQNLRQTGRRGCFEGGNR